MRTAGIFVLLALASIGCGEVDCPTGSEYDGRRCVLVDGGGDGSVGGDAATRDGGSTDGAPARDGCTSITFYRDADDDGFGDPSMTMEACVAPDGYVADSTDCDDGCVSCVPGGTENCDGADNDCDGAVDEGMLSLLGTPVSVSESAAGALAAATYGAGYLVAFEDASDRVRYVLLDRSGATVSGTPELIDPVGTASTAEDLPAVAISGVGSLATGIVAWRRNGRVRFRAIPISGASPPAAVEVDSPGDHSAPRVAASASSALVTWIDGPADIWGMQVDIETGGAVGEEVKLYGRTLRDFSPYFVAVGQAVTSVPAQDFFVLAFTDQRPGDDFELVYTDRVFADGGATAERAPTKLDTGLALPVRGVSAAHAQTAPAGSASVVITAVSDDSSPDFRSDAIPMSPTESDLGVEPRRDLSDGNTSPGSGGAGLVSYVTVNDDASTEPRMQVVDLGLPPGAERSISAPFGAYEDVTAVIARAGASDGAVLFTAGAGTKTLRFQRLGCSDD